MAKTRQIGLLVPKKYIYRHELFEFEREYNLSILQRIFVSFEDPQSSLVSRWIAFIVTIATLLSIITFILSTVPEVKHQPKHCSNPVCDHSALCPDSMICEPIAPEWFGLIEDVCLYIFVIDYGIRLFLCSTVPSRLAGCISLEWDDPVDERGEEIVVEAEKKKFFNRPDPEISQWMQQLMYIFRPMNLIDVIAIIPFFMDIAGTEGTRVYVIRVLRLARVFRILKLGKKNRGIVVLYKTMFNSLPALALLLFFSMIGVIFFGTVIFFFEQGNFRVTQDYPDGRYFRTDIDNMNKEISPFDSILTSMYWTVVTVTTVGYGDIVPTTYAGRGIAVLCMYCGMFVFALPISVIGNNFSRELDRIHGRFAETVSNSLIEVMNLYDYQSEQISAETNQHKMSDENSTGFQSLDPDGRLSRIAQIKAKKLSALVVLSKVLCDHRRQDEIMKLAKKKGLVDVVKLSKEMKSSKSHLKSSNEMTIAMALHSLFFDNGTHRHKPNTSALEEVRGVVDRVHYHENFDNMNRHERDKILNEMSTSCDRITAMVASMRQKIDDKKRI